MMARVAQLMKLRSLRRLQASSQFRRLAVIVLSLLFLSGTAIAEPSKIGWSDLVPERPQLVDPLDKLSFAQRFELESFLWVRQLSDEEKKAEDAAVIAEALGYEKSLKAAGISVDELVAEYVAFAGKLDEYGKVVRKELDGKNVKIEGYLLPLDFTPEGATEFLLVPFVGACIHVPPPPPNQIVLITLGKRLKINELFAPVRVTGNLQTMRSSRKLFLVDGNADIPLGYVMTDAAVKIVK